MQANGPLSRRASPSLISLLAFPTYITIDQINGTHNFHLKVLFVGLVCSEAAELTRVIIQKKFFHFTPLFYS
jgi:hypothetical protein